MNDIIHKLHGIESLGFVEFTSGKKEHIIRAEKFTTDDVWFIECVTHEGNVYRWEKKRVFPDQKIERGYSTYSVRIVNYDGVTFEDITHKLRDFCVYNNRDASVRRYIVVDNTYTVTNDEVITSFLEDTHTDRPTIEFLKEEVKKLREEVRELREKVNKLREKHNKLSDATRTVLINHNKTIHKLCTRSSYVVRTDVKSGGQK